MEELIYKDNEYYLKLGIKLGLELQKSDDEL